MKRFLLALILCSAAAAALAAPKVYRGTLQTDGGERADVTVTIDVEAPEPEPPPQPDPEPDPQPEPPPAPDANKYASPSGKATGDGSKARPWSLATALRNAPPESTTVVLPGVYRGRFACGLKDAKFQFYGAKIVQPDADSNHPGLLLTRSSSNLVIEGIEVYSEATKLTPPEGDDHRADGIRDEGTGNTIAHFYSHDNTQGLVSQHPAVGGRYVAGIVTANGYYRAGDVARPSGLHGHGGYVQNVSDTPKEFISCVSLDNAGQCFSIYTQSALVKQVKLTGCVTMLPAWAWGTRPENQSSGIRVEGQGDGIEVVRHYGYVFPAPRGDGGGNAFRGGNLTDKLSIRDSVFVGFPSLQLEWEGPVELLNNRFVSHAPGGFHAFYFDRSGGSRPGDSAQGNVLVQSGQSIVGRSELASLFPRFGAIETPAKLTEQWVHVETSPLRPDWRLVVIYNWTKQDRAAVNLPGLPAGEYKVVNVQRLDEDLPVTWSGSKVTIPLDARPVTQPRGEPVGEFVSTLTDKEFGCFLVCKTKYPF